MSGFEPVGEDDELDPLDHAFADWVGSQVDAIEFSTALMGPQLQLYKMADGLGSANLDLLSRASGLSGAIGSMNLDLLSSASGLCGAQFGVLAGLPEFEELLRNFPIRSGVGHPTTALDREQIRQLWGQYVYMQVLILCVLLLWIYHDEARTRRK